jgi:FAD/FMN-containing dehydrogenase
MTRRGFLVGTRRVAVAAAVASQARWLAGCADAATPSGAAWRDLAQRLNGYVLRPGDDGFYETALPHNLRYADVLPQGIAMCVDPTDVQTSILWARDNDIALVARAGSHSYAGYSSTPGLMINVTPMSGVAVDTSRGTVTSGAGARNSHVSAATAPHLIAIPQGRCPTVGIAGLTLGGGFGFSSRKLGLTSDRLIETTLVTAAGEIVVCNEREQSDLFWACRGGGGGNFGINASFTYEAVPVGDVSVFRLIWQGTDTAARLLATFGDILARASDEFSLRLGLSALPPGSREQGLTMSALGQYFGPCSELLELLAPALRVATPVQETIADMTFADASAFLAAAGPPNFFLERSSYAPAPLAGDAIATIVEQLQSWPGSSKSAYLTMFSWGGAISRVPADATAFVHREGGFLLAVGADWGTTDSQPVIDANLAWVNDFWSPTCCRRATRTSPTRS